jgi:hypothetical protein
MPDVENYPLMEIKFLVAERKFWSSIISPTEKFALDEMSRCHPHPQFFKK